MMMKRAACSRDQLSSLILGELVRNNNLGQPRLAWLTIGGQQKWRDDPGILLEMTPRPRDRPAIHMPS